MADTNDEKDPDFTLVENHAAALAEHFDSVRIVCTKLVQGETTTTSAGRGNWHAQHGSVRAWLIRQDAVERANAIAEEAVDEE